MEENYFLFILRKPPSLQWVLLDMCHFCSWCMSEKKKGGEAQKVIGSSTCLGCQIHPCPLPLCPVLPLPRPPSLPPSLSWVERQELAVDVDCSHFLQQHAKNNLQWSTLHSISCHFTTLPLLIHCCKSHPHPNSPILDQIKLLAIVLH